MILLLLAWLLAGPCADEIRAGDETPSCPFVVPRRPPPAREPEPWEI